MTVAQLLEDSQGDVVGGEVDGAVAEQQIDAARMVRSESAHVEIGVDIYGRRFFFLFDGRYYFLRLIFSRRLGGCFSYTSFLRR